MLQGRNVAALYKQPLACSLAYSRTFLQYF